MYEIISLYGRPFHQARICRQRPGVSSFNRVGRALLVIFFTLLLAGLAWIAYRTGLLKVFAAMAAALVPKGNLAIH
jgi:cbb3-type cytochrome oxidase subunit 3